MIPFYPGSWHQLLDERLWNVELTMPVIGFCHVLTFQIPFLVFICTANIFQPLRCTGTAI